MNCNNNDDTGKEHNEKAAKLILQLIFFGRQPIKRELTPLNYITNICTKNIQKYLSGTEKLECNIITSYFKQFYI